MYIVFDYDNDMVAEVETEQEAKDLAEATFGHYIEA